MKIDKDKLLSDAYEIGVAEVAKEAGMNPSSIYMMINGRKSPQWRSLEKIKAAVEKIRGE